MLSGSLLIIHGSRPHSVYVSHVRLWLQNQKEVQYPILITGCDELLVKHVLRELSDECYNTNDYMTLDSLLTLNPNAYGYIGIVSPAGVTGYALSTTQSHCQHSPNMNTSRITSQPYQYPLHLVS